MASSTDNVKLGVCTVLFDGIDLGYTKGGVEVSVSTESHEVTIDQFGNTPIGEIVTGRKVMAKVPLAETTLQNLVRIMPGATLVSDGSFSTGTVTFSTAPPVNNDSVTIAGYTFTYKTTPVSNKFDMAIPASVTAAANALRVKINASLLAFTATSSAGVVTLVADEVGVASNSVMTKTAATPANLTVTALAGGIDLTKAKVTVTDAGSANLLTLAKELTLRPRGTTGADDFVIHKAMCAGALNFSFGIDKERIYNADFKGYADSVGLMFTVGDITA